MSRSNLASAQPAAGKPAPGQHTGRSDPVGAAEPTTNAAEFSVGELANAIKRAIEDGFGHVRLRGEISGYRGPHASGHCYFALKDDKAKIDAVIWRGVFGKLRFQPEEGMEVVAQGKVTTYPNSSKYQIVIEKLEPAGVGALMALLEERKRKFAAEGLFDEARKKPLPFLPRVVGIVTSPTGAVIRDMMHGFNERFPAHVVVWPVRVQGETSAGEVAAAIRGFNAVDRDAVGHVPRPDVLIVARGGGSLEDLWSFNEEVVVRAAADCDIPLISAVGHETDWTLLDLVADARAPTPTKAAEWAVPKYADLEIQLGDLGQRLRHAGRRAVSDKQTQLKAAARGLPRLQDLLAAPRQRFDAVDQRMGRALLANAREHGRRLARVSARLQPLLLRQPVQRRQERIDTLGDRAGRALANRLVLARRALDGSAKLLETLSHRSVLARGFALVRAADGKPVRSAQVLTAGDGIRLGFVDGEVAAEVSGSGGGRASGGQRGGTAGKADAAGSGQEVASVRRRRQKPAAKQGSLFD